MGIRATKRDTQSRYDHTKHYFTRYGLDMLTAGRELHEVGEEFRELMKTGITHLVVICLNGSSLSHFQPQEIFGAVVERAYSALAEELKQALTLSKLGSEAEIEISKVINTSLDWAKEQVLKRNPQDMVKLLRQDAKQSYVC